MSGRQEKVAKLMEQAAAAAGTGVSPLPSLSMHPSAVLSDPPLAAEKKGINLISADDYFECNSEFRLWLLEKKKKYFDELSAEKARKRFADFCLEWNSGRLSQKFVAAARRWQTARVAHTLPCRGRYYDGIHPTELEHSSRTRHQWKFKNVNAMELDSARLRAALGGAAGAVAGC